MTKASELRGLEDADILTRLKDSRTELFNLRFQLATGRLDNNSRLTALKREIARLLTLQKERDLELVPEPAEPNRSTGRRGALASTEEQ